MGSPTVENPHRWPMVQPFYVRAPITYSYNAQPVLKDSRLENAFVELDPVDSEYWVYKRIGTGPFFSGLYAGGFPQGAYCYPQSNIQLTVLGGNIIYGSLIVGTVQPGYDCSFQTINSNPPTIMISNVVNATLFNTATSICTPITDTNFPVFRVPGIAYLDGTTYVMDSFGNIWGSKNLFDATTWDPLNKIVASNNPDSGIYLTTQLSYVIAFKQWTTQVFYDAQNATGSPLGPVPDSQIAFGCLNAASVKKMDEILFWISSNQTISPQVIMMENLQPRVISTPSIERLLDNIVTTAVASPSVQNDISLSCWTLKHGGHRFYGITSTSLNITLVYDIDQKFWTRWTDTNGNYYKLTNFTYIAPTFSTPGAHVGQVLPDTAANPITNLIQGCCYYVDGDYEYPNDNGVLFPVDIYTPNFTGGTSRRKTLNMMYFCADQTSGSILKARYSDDDFQSWSNFRSIDLNDDNPRLDQEGTFTKRAYHFRHQCNTPFRIKSGELQLDVGTL